MQAYTVPGVCCVLPSQAICWQLDLLVYDMQLDLLVTSIYDI